jgi:WD40 repeat protein
MNTPALDIPDDGIRFPSLDSLRAAHTELLKEFRATGSTPEMIAKVIAFIKRGSATGALLDSDSDRWAAQSQLDYWSTQLYRPGYEPPDATLHEFDPQLAPDLDDALCPYVGLDAFHERNQSTFFGRENLVGELVGKLKLVRFLAVLGSSGSGKSSVVRAGLIPELKKGALPSRAGWRYLGPMVPGSNPLKNLARLLAPQDGEANLSEEEIASFWRSETRLAETISGQSNGNVVLIVDQFEEIFTLCTDDEARRSFVDNLIRLSQAPRAEHRVIVTMRSDFEANVARLPELQAVLERGVVRITPLNASELREAIEAPAARIGLKFEEGVVAALLNDTLGEPAALPLLQFTLLKLWEHRERNRITWEAYRKLGGGRETLARSADEFYNHLIPEEQVTMRRILMKMVRPGDGLEVTSSRVRRAALYQKAEAHDRIDRVLNRLVQSRLVRVSEGDIAVDEQLEVAHEALIRNWPRLVGWLEEEHMALYQRARLTSAAEQWLRFGKDPSALRRGVLLQDSLRYNDLNDLETEFVQASLEAEKVQEKADRHAREQAIRAELAEKLAETEKRRAEEQAQTAVRLRLRNRVISVVSVIALLAAAVAILLAWQSSQNAEAARRASQLAQQQQELAQQASANAERERDHTQSLRLASESNLVTSRGSSAELGALLALQSLRIEYSQAADEALQQASFLDYGQEIFTPPSGTRTTVGMAVSPDGKTFATGDDWGDVRLWQVGRPGDSSSLLTNSGTFVRALAFSPDGKSLVFGEGTGLLQLWDITSGKTVRSFTGHTDAVQTVAYSHNGRYLASAGWDRVLRLWDVDGGDQLYEFPAYPSLILGVAFSPDDRSILTGSEDGAVILWDLQTKEQVQKFTGHTAEVEAVAFSHDGLHILTGSRDSTARFWDVATGQAVQILRGHTNTIFGVAFSPDDRYLLTGSGDRTARLWDAQTGQELHRYTGNTGYIWQVAFSANGASIFTLCNDGTVRMWTVQAQPLLRTLMGHRDIIWDVAYSPDGRYLLTGSGDITARLWDAKTYRQIREFDGHSRGVNSVAFSPDSKYVLTGSSDHRAILWDTETGEMVHSFDNDSDVFAVTFSVDGSIAFTGAGDGKLSLWNVQTGEKLGSFEVAMLGIRDVEVSPDGRYLLWTGDDAVIWVENLETSQTQTLIGHTHNIFSASFSPDSKYIVSGSQDLTARLWDVQTGEQISVFPHSSDVFSAVFSPDGKQILTGTAGNIAYLWDVDQPERPVRDFVGHTSLIFSSVFSPDGKFIATASWDQTVRVWDTNYPAMVDWVCSRLLRELDNGERQQYNITSLEPVCPARP